MKWRLSQCREHVVSASQVGTSRSDIPGRVQRAERISQDVRAAAHVAPLYAARTAQPAAQRAVPTPLNRHPPLGGEGENRPWRESDLPFASVADYQWIEFMKVKFPSPASCAGARREW